MFEVSKDAVKAIEAISENYEGGTYVGFTRDLKSIVEKIGLEEALQSHDKREFEARALALYGFLSARRFQAFRLKQIVASNFRFWIYHCHSCEFHNALDGLMLPSDHQFWKTHYPANCWGCGCSIYGARSEVSAKIMGCDPMKQLPFDWQDQMQVRSSHFFVPLAFQSQQYPDTVRCIQALQSGEYLA